MRTGGWTFKTLNLPTASSFHQLFVALIIRNAPTCSSGRHAGCPQMARKLQCVERWSLFCHIWLLDKVIHEKKM